MQGHGHHAGAHAATFPAEADGLPVAAPAEVLDVPDGGSVRLEIAPVAKRLAGHTVRMLAYGGSIPGPTLRVQQGSQVEVEVVNRGDLADTVHWHGLRLDNRFDGTHETQAPIPVGGTFRYRLSFPDPGLYWYHPHVREDYGQEMGLYGNIVVVPAEPGYWPPVHRDLALTLDDVLLEDGRIASFSPVEVSHSAMGRYGNVMLVAGETEPVLHARRDEVVRLMLTNTANARVFNVGVDGARMKLVGGDSGRVEQEEFVERVILAPSERTVVDVLFSEPDVTALTHLTPERTYQLARFEVGERQAPPLAEAFASLRVDPELRAERERLPGELAREPDKVLALVAEMDMGAPEGAVVFACPMHPDVIQEAQGRCPLCGMLLLAVAATYTCPMHPDVVQPDPGRCPSCGMALVSSALVAQGRGGGHAHADDPPGAHGGHGHHGHDQGAHESSGAVQAGMHASGDGIEWEDDMAEVNRLTTPANTHWRLVDRETGAVGAAINWRFRVGDRVKIRLINEMDSDHPMQHPFHVHGAGRFLVIARDGVPSRNLMWKDTVLVRTGETVGLVLDVSNPGRWMAHCHIAEHHESGMMLSFDVDE